MSLSNTQWKYWLLRLIDRSLTPRVGSVEYAGRGQQGPIVRLYSVYLSNTGFGVCFTNALCYRAIKTIIKCCISAAIGGVTHYTVTALEHTIQNQIGNLRQFVITVFTLRENTYYIYSLHMVICTGYPYFNLICLTTAAERLSSDPKITLLMWQFPLWHLQFVTGGRFMQRNQNAIYFRWAGWRSITCHGKSERALFTSGIGVWSI